MKKRVPARWIRNASDRLAVSEGCWFDEDAGVRVCSFVERFCCQSQGRWSGKPIVLMDWQRDWLMRTFGWKRADGTRRFRRVYLEVPKKNGKSTLVSALVLYLVLADREGGPKVFINACDREQAKIVYNEAALMVENSPSLSAKLTVGRSKHTISSLSNNGVIRANSADAPSKDGANASAWVFDELHRQPNRIMYDMFRYSGDARDQPLEITITTAGEDMTGVWYELREYSEKVDSGEIPDWTHFGLVYAAKEDDNIDDPEVWKKANPSIGTILSIDDFRRQLAEAKERPEKLANFLRLKLGIITTSDAKFLDPFDWKACDLPLRNLSGRHGYGGFDLSSVRDLTAWSMIFPDSDGTFDVIFRVFMPEENVIRNERVDKVPYRQWIRTGDLITTPGSSIDHDFIRQQIQRDCEELDIRVVFADPWNAEMLSQTLISEGINLKYIRQGWSLNSPTKELQRTIIDRRLRHAGHRVATWTAGNAIAKTDSNANIMLCKKKSRHRIDPMAALVNAFGAYLSDPLVRPSIYEQGVYVA